MFAVAEFDCSCGCTILFGFKVDSAPYPIFACGQSMFEFQLTCRVNVATSKSKHSCCTGHNRKETTMFTLRSTAAKPSWPAGTKRHHSETPALITEGFQNAPAAVSHHDETQSVGPDDKACFQLLHVRGIPDWANRCVGFSTCELM